MIPVKLGAKVVIINQFRPEARSQESEVKMLQTARPYDCRTAQQFLHHLEQTKKSCKETDYYNKIGKPVKFAYLIKTKGTEYQ
jgi:hypothetical protein